MRWNFLLRPGWLALTAVVLLFATACFTLLAPWQFDRHAERSARNATLRESFEQPPKPLLEVLPSATAPTREQQWQQISVRGRYLPADEAVARLRTIDGRGAFEVLTPFRLDSGRVVLVNRGYVRPTSGNDVPDYARPPRGEVELRARIRAGETDPQQREPLTGPGGKPQVYAINPATVAHATGSDISPGYLQLSPRQPGILNPVPLPQLESGPFLSYALQWIAFGTMALLGWLYFTWREARPGGALHGTQRRKSVAEILAEDEDAALPESGHGESGHGETSRDETTHRETGTQKDSEVPGSRVP